MRVSFCTPRFRCIRVNETRREAREDQLPMQLLLLRVRKTTVHDTEACQYLIPLVPIWNGPRTCKSSEKAKPKHGNTGDGTFGVRDGCVSIDTGTPTAMYRRYSCHRNDACISACIYCVGRSWPVYPLTSDEVGAVYGSLTPLGTDCTSRQYLVCK